MIEPKVSEAWRILTPPVDTDSLETANAAIILRHAFVETEWRREKAEWTLSHCNWRLDGRCAECVDYGVDPRHDFTDADWRAAKLKELSDDTKNNKP